jgi:hypothetical protein
VAVVEIQRLLVGIKGLQPFNVIIPTRRVETIVAPNTNFVRGGVLIGSITNLGCGLGGVSMERNMNRSLGLLAVTIGVVGTPQMVFINPIMTTHINRTTNRPLMSSIAVGRYININVENLRGYQEPSIITIGFSNHKNDHSVWPNMVAFKYLNFKKNVNIDVHVRVFNFAVKANAKTSKEYIINAFKANSSMGGTTRNHLKE